MGTVAVDWQRVPDRTVEVYMLGDPKKKKSQCGR